jgi:thiamine biosynthesis lipoprotein
MVMMRRFASAVTTLMLLMPAAAQAEWHSREAAIMGTRIAVELWDEDAGQAEAAIDAVIAEMHRIDDLMSHYRPESQLSRINREAANGPVKVDAELAALIARALDFSELSGGAFDITYASVGYLYDYREHRRPSEAQIQATLPAISWRHVVVDREASTVRFTQPGVRIDLGGIAKGYAVDNCLRILRARGIRNASVTAGGDTGLLGDRRGRPWIVGIRHPDDPNRVIARIPLEDAAISTSGDYEHYFDENGVRYHHIIDPHTGKSPTGVRSVTVIGPSAILTEGLTKSVFVMGPERGLALIETQEDMDAVVVRSDGRVFYSKGLAPPDEGKTP